MSKKAWKQQWNNILNSNIKQKKNWERVLAATWDLPMIETFLDVGVGNKGSEAWSVHSTHPNCKIFGFEPQTERYEMLREEYPGTLFNMAISDIDGETDGYMGFIDGGKSDFQLHPSRDYERGAYKKVKIVTRTLDVIEREEHGPFNNAFIWADVEGSELKVLRGADGMFRDNKIIGVLVELRRKPMGKGACTAVEVDRFLTSKGFTPTMPLGKLKGGHKDFIYINQNIK